MRIIYIVFLIIFLFAFFGVKVKQERIISFLREDGGLLEIAIKTLYASSVNFAVILADLTACETIVVNKSANLLQTFTDGLHLHRTPPDSLRIFSGVKEQFLLATTSVFSPKFMLMISIIIILLAIIFLIYYVMQRNRLLIEKERERMIAHVEQEIKKRTQELVEQNEHLEQTLQQQGEKLSETERVLESIISAIQDELLIVDKEGKILDANQRFLERHQLIRDRIIGTACSQYEFYKFICGSEETSFVEKILKEEKPLQ
ncbi:MAG: hypothetical protein N2246_08320, partial [Candidatus Sumerlaeia bacterium]|nr:hypothetical protein [Candidatus Sumerlaeia bacterium]